MEGKPALERLFLGLDQGGSSTKGVIIDSQGAVLWSESIEVTTETGINGEVEQDAVAIADSIKSIFSSANSFCRMGKRSLSAMGLSTQRSAVVAWDVSTAEALHPVMTWRDTRLSKKVEEVCAKRGNIFEKTGLPLTVHYAAPKFAYLQKLFSGAKQVVSSLDSYLLWNLTRKLLAETSMAARTMLYSLESKNWDPELCKVFGVDQLRLPPIVPSIYERGKFKSIPIMASIGDAQASCIALSDSSMVPVLTLGTVASLMIPTGARLIRKEGFISSILKVAPNGTFYEIEGTESNCGALIELIVQRKKLVNSAAEIDSICEEEEQRVGEGGALGYFPLVGSGPPNWYVNLKSYTDKPIESDPKSYVRAVFESLAFGISKLILELQNALELPFRDILVSGGVASSDYLLQRISDVTGVTLNRSSDNEQTRSASAIGAAILAAEGVGAKVVCRLCGEKRTFVPGKDMNRGGVARARFARWRSIESAVLNGKANGLIEIDLR